MIFNKKLSICIPTFNRAKPLENLLESIYKQVKDINIEIIIVDNCSDDETKQTVQNWIEKSPIIKYFRNDKNIGFDMNLKSAISKANGDYIWIVGDDDAIIEGAIASLISNLDKYSSDMFILSGFYCDSDLKPLRERKILKPRINTHEFVINDSKSLIQYIDSINNNLSFLFAFITSIVFKKNVWENTIPEKLINSKYDHAYRFLAAVKNGLRLTVLPQNYYYSRASLNEYKKFEGNHLLLDLSAYKSFIMAIFHDDHLYISIRKHLGKLFMRQHSFRSLVRKAYELKSYNLNSDLFCYLKFYKVSAIKIIFIKLFSNKIIYKTISYIYERK